MTETDTYADLVAKIGELMTFLEQFDGKARLDAEVATLDRLRAVELREQNIASMRRMHDSIVSACGSATTVARQMERGGLRDAKKETEER